ncbi:MAG: peptidylprolyl isomerase [Spirochaetia bacterium]|jgi:FKBP-type peptidyl-prolyl cis-trans isomerase 2|nr:peptidylprolyl isomerase [Spirochaetia bacterium]
MIAENKYVVLHYVGLFEDGQVFDTSINKAPFQFQIGAHEVVPGFENAVREMEVDQEKEVIIPPELAYGLYDDKKKRRFPIDEIRKSFEPKEGMIIGMKTPNGGQVPVVITQVTDHEVELDANHPFAGKPLKFKLILLEINDERKFFEEVDDDSCGCEDSSCGHDDEHVNWLNDERRPVKNESDANV